MIKKIGGFGSILLICFFILLQLYALMEKYNLKNNTAYTKGISEGLKAGVRGHIYLHYNFKNNGILFHSSVPNDFCQECHKCCSVGDTVIVKFEKGNPNNNDLIVELPKGAILETGN